MSEKTLKQTTIVESTNTNSCCKRFQRKPKKRKRTFNNYKHNYRYLLNCYRIINNKHKHNNIIKNNINNNCCRRSSSKETLNTKVMLIDVMANNVMLSKNIQRSQLLKNHLKALHITDYCFELSPHDFGGPPPLYAAHHQLEETNKETILQYIGHQQQQELLLQLLLQQNNTTTTANTTITNTTKNINNDNS